MKLFSFCCDNKKEQQIVLLFGLHGKSLMIPMIPNIFYIQKFSFTKHHPNWYIFKIFKAIWEPQIEN